MARWTYKKGLHDLGGGAYAYLQPDGAWGWSNAGLIVSGEQSLLVDTLFDERLTVEMLSAMKAATGRGGAEINTLVNTHANGDHTYGNRLVEHAEVIASRPSAEEMTELPPAMLAALVAQAPNLGELGAYVTRIFGPFDFPTQSAVRLPTRTFERELELQVGDKAVHLFNVGPAHTRGDTLVYVPADQVVFTGDILFIDVTPIMWAGPVHNWIAACERIVALDVRVIVPGHGPITDKDGVRRVRDYLRYIDREARARFDAGLSAEAAAEDIPLGDYAAWGDAERIVVNVDTLYHEYRGSSERTEVLALFSRMAKFVARRRR